MVFGGVRRNGSIRYLGSSVITFEEGQFERRRVYNYAWIFDYI